MSLVSTYVRATDGGLYRDPVLGDENDNWFICFDDDDDPELVIKAGASLKPEQVLEKIGLKYTNLRKNHGRGSRRIFGNKLDFYDARAYFFDIKGRFDPKWIVRGGDKPVKESGIVLGVLYDFPE